LARVLFACGASSDYIRNRTIVSAASRNHRVEVIGSAAGGYPRRLATVLPRVLASRGPFDVHLAGFLGQPLMPLFWARGLRPIILDAFLSVYDTLCMDRQTFSPRSPAGRAFHRLDSWSMRRARCVLTDTEPAADFMAREFGVPRANFLAVPVGADESLFYPRPGRGDGAVDVLYVCTYLPLHGVPVVVEAANLLRGRDDITFTLIGRGPERPRVEGMARKYGLANCRFLDWVPFEELPERIAACDIFLGGHFNGANEKARRVVAGKVYQGLAMAKATVIGDCEASRISFRHGESAYLVPMGEPRALADAILELAGSPGLRDRIGQGGRSLYEQRFSEGALAALLDRSLEIAVT